MRRVIKCSRSIGLSFQSTHLVWGATQEISQKMKVVTISIHAPRVRCDKKHVDTAAKRWISIHAPRVRCDRIDLFIIHLLIYFNPRTSCEVRPYRTEVSYKTDIFQSTHLVWGATWISSLLFRCLVISIHAPRVRCDALIFLLIGLFSHFNPRTSCEVRHLIIGAITHLKYISIHAPRVRCDGKERDSIDIVENFNPRTSCEVRLFVFSLIICLKYFNPRTSCEVRLISPSQWEIIYLFQSTHLVWGATLIIGAITHLKYISIHAPRVRCDCCRACRWTDI